MVFLQDLGVRDPDPQSDADRSRGEAPLSLFEWVEDGDSLQRKAARQRRKERRRLARTIKWNCCGFKHPCPPGCCASEDIAKKKLFHGKRHKTTKSRKNLNHGKKEMKQERKITCSLGLRPRSLNSNQKQKSKKGQPKTKPKKQKPVAKENNGRQQSVSTK